MFMVEIDSYVFYKVVFNLSLKPLLYDNYKTNHNFYKLYCKNFIYMMFLLEYWKSELITKNYKMLVFKKNKKFNSFLSAPYKNKKSQIQLKEERYMLVLFFYFKLDDFLSVKIDSLKKSNVMLNIVNYLKDLFLFFESSTMSVKKKEMSISVKCLNMFIKG